MDSSLMEDEAAAPELTGDSLGQAASVPAAAAESPALAERGGAAPTQRGAFSIAELASRLRFGPEAFRALERHVPCIAHQGQELSQHQVVSMVLASVPEAQYLKGERGANVA